MPLKTMGFLHFFFLVSFAFADGLAPLSKGAAKLWGAKACAAYEEKTAQLATKKAVDCISFNSQSGNQENTFLELSERLTADAEGSFFSSLALQHVAELQCAYAFARQIGIYSAPNIRKQIIMLRDAKLQLNRATEKLAQNPSVSRKVCPLAMTDLKPDPVIISITGTDLGFELCKEVIVSRSAYNAIFNSIPLSGVPTVHELLERVANSTDSEITTGPWLEQSIRNAYSSGSIYLSERSDEMASLARKGGNMDRGAKYAMMEDPLVIDKVIQAAGPANRKTMEAVACHADQRYHSGADALEKTTVIGTALLSGGAGFVLRSTGLAAKIALSTNEMRAAGMLSFNASRSIQFAALATTFTAGAVGTTAIVNKACLSFDTPTTMAQGTGKDLKCVSAPSVKQLDQDMCLLESSLAAIGFVSSIKPLVTIGGQLKKISDVSKQKAWLQSADIPKVSPLALSDDVRKMEIGNKIEKISARVEIKDLKLRHERFTLPRQSFYDKDALYIGVSNSSKEGLHHYSLIAGNKRYDGIPMGKSQVTDIGANSSLSKGVLFKINVSDDVVQKVSKAIQKNKGARHLSCLHGVCKVLKDADITLDGVSAKGRKLRLKPVLHGIMDANMNIKGQKLSKEQVKLIATSKQELEHFIRRTEVAEAGARKSVIVMGSIYGSVVVEAGVLGYVVYEITEEEDDD